METEDFMEIEDDIVFLNRQGDIDNLLGKVAYSEDKANEFYNDYALRIDFSVQNGKVRYFTGSKNICSREYLCSKEGFRKDTVSYEEKKVNRLETRTGCKAFIRFAKKEGTWKVVAFNAEHNHELSTSEERHLLKSRRCVSKPKAGAINSMVNAGIKTKDAFSYLSKEVGGVENIGFTKRDCYNYANKQKMTMISAGYAQSLIKFFKARQAEDPMFFYTVQVDQENHMTNFFRRDGRSRTDYDCFGDVVVFDATYMT